MKRLEPGQSKMQQICDVLRKETLEPAQQEARAIIEEAERQAAALMTAAKKEAEALLQKTKKELEEKKTLFEVSLRLAAEQGVAQLKNRIEKEFFNKDLAEIVAKEMGGENPIAALIDRFFQVIRERGIDDSFSLVIPKGISPKQISALVAKKVLETLQEHPIALGEFAGGVQIRLAERKITIDISDEAVRALLSQYIRRDFRELLFQS
ncbi:MAG: hypothetical protein KGI80_01200 [Verrucomicrobiota bacterium]|nr:hypothetical protein [Verrucomicrobiota bacterium]